MTAPKILVTRPLAAPVIDYLKQFFNVDVINNEKGAAPEELRQRAQECDAILVSTDKIDAEFCRAVSPRCRIIANHGVGYNNIDVDAATRYGIFVTNTPDVVTDDTADLAMALILA
ncbi:MAG: D-glycerate dehydrogenase, partial [Negativicutes bacterium]|nr:D-glycerate dehydrogenase [Negativicutes bacterium]